MDSAVPLPPSTEIVDLDAPPPSPSPSRRGRGTRIALVATGTALALGMSAGAFAISSYLSGGGAQPDDVLRSGALAFAKIDLDPAASQKLAVWQLSKKFPALPEGGKDAALEESVVAWMLEDSALSYDADVRPWLGDRAALAVYPPASPGAEPQFALALQYTDEAPMAAAMEKLVAEGDTGFTTRQGYVVLSDTDATAEALAAETPSESLAEQEDLQRDVDALEGDQLAVAWVDYGRILTAVSGSLTGEEAVEFDQMFPAGANLPTGRFAIGLRAASDFLEVQGRAFDVTGSPTVGEVAGTNLAGELPADSVAALSVTGIPEAYEGLLSYYEDLLAVPAGMSASDMLTEGAAEFGVELPGDIGALFGTETAVAVAEADREIPNITMRARGGDIDRVTSLADALAALTGIEATVLAAGDGFVLGNDAATVRTAAAGEDRLADTASFTRAVPDAAGAGVVAYMNIARAAEQGLLEDLSPTEAANLEALDAVGFTCEPGPDGAFRLRLTVR